MATQTFFDNEYATLWYHIDTKIIHCHIVQYISGEKLKELFCTGMEVLKTYKADKWISDDRKNRALTLRDQDWVKNLWLPSIARQGLKYWAIVEPEKIEEKMKRNGAANLFIQNGVMIASFFNPEEAMNWLVKQ